MEKKWYQTFFEGVVVDTWKAVVPQEVTDAEVDFLERHLQIHPTQSILDVPCGYGRHSCTLASRGYKVTGVDVSPDMIRYAKEAANAAELSIKWLEQDMNGLAELPSFDAAFCFGNSFGYLDRDETEQFLKSIAELLPAGGRFAFDYGLSAESILPRFQEREWAPIDDLLFLEHNEYRMEDSCIETTYSFIQDGKVDTRIGLHYVFTNREIRVMLAHAGFKVADMFESTDEDPFRLGSHVLICVAEKE